MQNLHLWNGVHGTATSVTELVAFMHHKPLSPDLLPPSLSICLNFQYQGLLCTWGSVSLGKRTFWMKTKLLFPDFCIWELLAETGMNLKTVFYWCSKQRNALSWKIFMLFIQNDTCSMHLRLTWNQFTTVCLQNIIHINLTTAQNPPQKTKTCM